MGVEVAESNSALNVENSNNTKMPAENGKVSIKFGSHGGEEPANAEVKKVSESNLPKDAVDDWPEPQQIHSFYVVRYRPIEDQHLKAKLDVAEKELQKKNQARVQIIDKLKAKRADRSQLIVQIRSLSSENKQFRNIMDEKRKEMEPLQQALGKLRGGNAGGRERSSGICSSEAELNDVIKSLQYRIQHESIPLSEEKQILRDIKQLEGTREKVMANAAERAKIQDALGEKESIQDQVKLMGVGLDGARKEKQVINAKLKQLDEEKAVIEKALGVLEEELTELTEKRDKTFEYIREMRKQREDGNTPFYENRTLLTKAKVLATNKDVEALKELADTEVEKFMSLWNSNKAFRDDYERRILPSLDMRQLGRDGRLRNPDEKPLVQVAKPTPSQPELVKTSSKQPPAKETIVSPAQVDAVSEQKAPQKAKSAKNNKDGNKNTKIGKTDQEEEEEFFTSGNKLENVSKKDEVVDEKKLKEMKREEEIAKRNQAEERKKKQAEKAAAKAAIKAQKEAEKKLKEREKRARKKSGAPAESEEPTEAVVEVAEQEKIEDKVETTPVPQKNKERKENAIRSRGGRPRGPESVSKAILKRKKATNYWVYAGPAAAVVIIILLAVGYSYYSA